MFSFWTRVLPRATAVSLCRFRFNRVWAHVLCFSIPVSSVQAIVIGETFPFAWRRHRSPWTVLRARVAVRFEIYSSALCCAYTTLVKNFGGTCLFFDESPGSTGPRHVPLQAPSTVDLPMDYAVFYVGAGIVLGTFRVALSWSLFYEPESMCAFCGHVLCVFLWDVGVSAPAT